MKHGKKLIRLKGKPSRQRATLRNLVTALLQHESIETTMAKAKAAAPVAEKIITLGKRNTRGSRSSAQSFLFPPHYNNDPEVDTSDRARSLLPKVFETLRERYANREGGYTRIFKNGHREYDHAPAAILQLVDGPKDARFDMVARIVGKEVAEAQAADLEDGGVITGELSDWRGSLSYRTVLAMDKVLVNRGEAGAQIFQRKARHFADQLIAQKSVHGGEFYHKNPKYPDADEEELNLFNDGYLGYKTGPGQRLAGMDTTLTGLGLAKGQWGRRNTPGPRRGKSVVDTRPKFLQDKTRDLELANIADQAQPATATNSTR